MTATYTPEVAKARERLEKCAYFKVRAGDKMADAHPDLRLLLADHAQLAEANAKLHTIIDRQARKLAKLGERLHRHRVKLAKLQNEAAEHYSERDALKARCEACEWLVQVLCTELPKRRKPVGWAMVRFLKIVLTAEQELEVIKSAALHAAGE